MKGKQIISLLAAASMAMGCLTGCGAGQETVTGGSTVQGSTAQGSQGAGSSTEKVVLRLSMNMTLGSKGIVEEVMNDVLKDYPNVELQVEETAQDSYVSKMAMDVSTDNVADLVQYWRPVPLPTAVRNILKREPLQICRSFWGWKHLGTGLRTMQ